MKRIIVAILFLTMISSISFAQTWKRYRKEYVYSIGATNLLADLGGANQIGTHFVKDLDIRSTRIFGGFGYRYRIDRHQSIRGNVYLGFLYGNDNLTLEPARQYRNLIVRTQIAELSGQYEYFVNKDKDGHRYNIKHAHGSKNIHLHTYAFAGAGVLFYNPQGPYPGGGWVSLKPLGTEGQNVPNSGIKQYNRITAMFPVGIGTKYAITKHLSLGLEVSVRYTLTNYLEDVGGLYYDKKAIIAAGGPDGGTAGYFSDPSNGANPGWTTTGEVRGKKNKDTYMYMNLTLNQRIAPKRTKAKF